jgi:dTDP-4-dehydrorhamnose reductase
VVADQVLTPSATHDVAESVARLVKLDASGTVHVTNQGQCSWYEFAAEIFRLAGVRANLSPVTQAERPTPARRPAYSVLGHEGLRRLGVEEPRPWQEALAAYIAARP